MGIIDPLPLLGPITTATGRKTYRKMIASMDRLSKPGRALPEIIRFANEEINKQSIFMRMLNAIRSFRKKPKLTTLSKPSDNVLLN